MLDVRECCVTLERKDRGEVNEPLSKEEAEKCVMRCRMNCTSMEERR